MKRHDQTILGLPTGDCLRACVASLLDCDTIDEVPHFMVEPLDDWYVRLSDWLRTKYLEPVATSKNPGPFTVTGSCILLVDIPAIKDETWCHAVVGHRDNSGKVTVVHDPHPGNRKRNPPYEILGAINILRNAV